MNAHEDLEDALRRDHPDAPDGVIAAAARHITRGHNRGAADLLAPWRAAPSIPEETP